MTAPAPGPVDILIIDDRPQNLVALEAVLGKPGITVARATSGAQALALVPEHDYAVVILDVQMPVMDGFEVARRIRANERHRSTPIIFLTAFEVEPPLVHKAYASGAVDFVIKPFDPQILWSKVSVFVDLFRKSGEIAAQGKRLVAAQAAAQAAAELERIDRLKDEFLATLAHELRNPLMSLLTTSETLQRHPVTDPVLARRHALIHRQIAHLRRLVDDALEISRFTQGKIEIQLESFDLREALERAVELSQSRIDARGLRLSVSLPREAIGIAGDQVRVAQVVSNLLDNAAKFTEPGGRVWLTLEATGQEAVIQVRDTGRGIPPERLGQIFEPFVQGEAGDASRGGLGIGLALVRRLVGLHGGTVTAASEGAGRGAEVVVRLPLEQRSGAGAGAAPARSEIHDPGAPSPAPPVRVLVVDDNPEIRSTVQLFLQLEGHSVATVDCGSAALEQISRTDPDVVLLDIALPDIDGYAVAQQVRAARPAPRPRLIAMTGNAGVRERDRALRAGFDAHVTKPVDGRTLLRLVAGE